MNEQAAPGRDSIPYDSADKITEEVLARYALTEDPRLREIVMAVIRHLHSFAREVNLTWSEWEFAMEYLYKAGTFCKGPRNEFIALSDTLGLTMLMVAATQPKPEGATLPTLIGPFYVPNPPEYAFGTDISNGAQGTPVHVSGRILRLDGQPVADAAIDVWHSDDRGLYDVLDDFEENGPWGRARLRSDEEGRYAFWSIMPTAYPAPTDGALGDLFMNTTHRYWRPAHLHFSIVAPGCDPLVTHLFASDSDYLDQDVAFGVRPGLVVDFAHCPAGEAADGRVVEVPYRALTYDFVLTSSGG